MKIKSFKCTCGHDDFFFANKGNQTGIFCSECGKWFKWADKDEKNLQLKSPSVAEILDKISAEIKEKAFTEEIFDEEVFKSTYTESVTRETAEEESVIETEIVKLSDIFEIIDKYKGVSE